MPPLKPLSIAALAALAFVAACGPSADPVFRRAIADGDRAQTAGRHLEAAQRFEEAAKSAREPSDREYALSLAASSYARANDKADAARILDVLAQTPPAGGSVALRARFDRALLTLDTDEDASLDALERFVVEHPESALSRRALAIVLERRAKGDPKARLVILERVLPRTRQSELEQRVRYDIAIAHEDLGDGARARSELLALAHDFPYPKGTLFDDSLFRASQIDERLGHYDDAIADLRTMLAQRETTSLIGSYERPKYLPAAMRIAEIYRDRLHALDKARDAYLAVYDDFANSTARDDALFEAALVSRRMGDQDGVCSAMHKLVHNLPESRYASCADRLCPAVGQGATKKCPDYIVRKIETNEKDGR